jgi:hypothetical protein
MLMKGRPKIKVGIAKREERTLENMDEAELFLGQIILFQV